MVGVSPARRAVPGKGPGRPEQLVPAAIVEANVHLTPLITAGDLLGLPAQGPQLLVQRRQIPEKAHFHPVPLHAADGLQQILLQKAHDGGDLLRRALPVLRGKSVDRQILQTDVLAVGGNGSKGLGPRGVSGGAGQAPSLGPPAIAVHNDGYVPRQAVKVYLGGRILLFSEQRHVLAPVGRGGFRPAPSRLKYEACGAPGRPAPQAM